MRAAAESGCLWCGAQSVEQHHVTGRTAPGGEYFDPALTTPLCVRHHAAQHVLLRRIGLDWPEPGGLALPYRLRRLGVALGRVADLRRPFVLSVPASLGAHALLIEAADSTDPAR
jgi:hypothetical protein